MQPISNRTVVIVSGLLTLIALSFASLGVAVHNGWLRSGGTAGASRPVEAAPSMLVADDALAPGDGRDLGPAVDARNQNDAADANVPRQKLDEAYKALDEAYAQIQSLQAAQQPQGRAGRGERESDERGEGRRSGERRHRSHESRDGDDD